MSSKDNDVTIKVDSRVLYGVIALVAVIGIFGIGWWLGNQINGDSPTETANAPVDSAVNAPPPAGAAPVIDSSGMQVDPAIVRPERPDKHGRLDAQPQHERESYVESSIAGGLRRTAPRRLQLGTPVDLDRCGRGA